MYIANTSFFVDHDVNDRWLDVINQKFIPFLRENHKGQVTFCRVVKEHDDGHFTYTLMCECESTADYLRLRDELMPEYTNVASALFGDRVQFLNTLLKKL